MPSLRWQYCPFNLAYRCFSDVHRRMPTRPDGRLHHTVLSCGASSKGGDTAPGPDDARGQEAKVQIQAPLGQMKQAVHAKSK